jgi:hypothetical protein
MTHTFRHPKHYKEMRKLQASNKHQASSLGGPPSIKPQASSIKLGGPAHNQAPDVKKKI